MKLRIADQEGLFGGVWDIPGEPILRSQGSSFKAPIGACGVLRLSRGSLIVLTRVRDQLIYKALFGF